MSCLGASSWSLLNWLNKGGIQKNIQTVFEGMTSLQQSKGQTIFDLQ